MIMPQGMADNGLGQIYLSVTIASYPSGGARTFLVSFEAATGALVWKILATTTGACHLPENACWSPRPNPRS